MDERQQRRSARLWHLAWVGCYISRIDIISLAFCFFFCIAEHHSVCLCFPSRLALSFFAWFFQPFCHSTVLVWFMTVHFTHSVWHFPSTHLNTNTQRHSVARIPLHCCFFPLGSYVSNQLVHGLEYEPNHQFERFFSLASLQTRATCTLQASMAMASTCHSSTPSI
jgi:hypothetical protein